MPRHLAFAIIPAHGHVNPTLPLVEELTRRGHRVSYLTGEVWQGPVEAAGADFVPIAAGYPPARGRTARAQRAGCARCWRASSARRGRPVRNTLRALQADPPDALC